MGNSTGNARQQDIVPKKKRVENIDRIKEQPTKGKEKIKLDSHELLAIADTSET